MKLKEEFIFQEIEDQGILVPTGQASEAFHGILKTNETGSFIIECLRTQTSEEEIVDKMLKEYKVDKERARIGVQKIIHQLQEIDALE